ncbi:amidohydrolase family protein [Muriicola sp. Z0-33]|uniref:amidohydrolase family protein n=1 Tax=Muriicola sp. Z0-33 TaxID=2816957 RepID=UPI002238DF8C|nr:amidohydrolase family protein [Muriicola sp. Z0-33]MCW5518087.1 amidohydrolase family protein [Muriicola sp. Z0-33]
MKHLKNVIKIIAALLLTLTIVCIVFLVVNAHNTAYLKIKNNPGLNETSYLITNINIVPMSKDTILANKTLWVKNGIIENIADSIVLEGIEIIDGKSKFLSPGLVDMHTHLWDKQELGLYLANGVTTIRNLWGYPMHLRIKKALNAENIIGPQFYTSSPKLTGENDLGDDKVQISTPEKAKQLVISYKKRGFDFIKTYAGIPENIENAILEQSILSNISVVAHPSREIPYLDQFQPQISSIEHAEEIIQQALEYKLDSLKLDTIIQKFALTQKSFCPTLTGYYKIFEMLELGENVLTSDPAYYINPLIQKVDSKVQYDRWANEKENNSSIKSYIYAQHQFHLYIIKRMNEAGVNIICGTDAGIGITAPGYSIHQELGLYKEAGLSNYDVLKTATINPTKTHKELEQIGSIEEGKLANFILTSKNPLEDLSVLSNPEWVMIKGRKIDKILMNEFTENAQDRNNLVVTALRYAEYLFIER